MVSTVLRGRDAKPRPSGVHGGVDHSEVPMGASFTLLRAQTGENGWYFVGTDGEKKHFEANLTLTE